MQQYKGLCQVIAIYAINNFSVYRILKIYSEVSFNSYRYHTTNNFGRLIEEEGSEITFLINTLIFSTIGMHIGPSGFLKADVLEVMFNIDKTIPKELIIVEKICAKLVVSRCINLDWSDY